MTFDYNEINYLAKAYESLTKEDLLTLVDRLKKELEQLKHVNKELSGCLEWHIQENERLEKRLENAVFTDVDYEPKPKRTIEL